MKEGWGMTRKKYFDTELLAVNRVKDLCCIDEYLDPYINDKDRKPIWDGEIQIHKNKRNSKGLKKDDILGIVNVQVKGVSHIGKFPPVYDYDVAKEDIQGFAKIGGTVFFVTLINQNSPFERTVYYKEFSPVDCNNLLAIINKQKRVKFTKFEDEKDSLKHILENFDNNCRKQISMVKAAIKLKSISEDDGKLFIEYTPKSNKIKNHTDFIEDFLSSKANAPLYFEPRNQKDIYIPIQDAKLIDIIVEFDNNKPVIINDKKYFNNVRRAKSREETRYYFDDIVTFFFRQGDDKRLHYKFNGNIDNQIKGLEFLLELMKLDSNFFAKEEINQFDYICGTLKKYKDVIEFYNLKDVFPGGDVSPVK